ncbi:DUF2924 domain-containing protein [Candidatus Avelusimicrobium alvi]|uniref:DUF2924 domain-containing protein n=1 Tax=Candidatus Avelusimicrobium alvi TaxID=3416221 RepID=UPI003D0B9956
MRNKCYLPKSLEELKGLSNEKLQFYWDIFYRYPLRGRKCKYRPLWYAIQCELYSCKLAEKYITRLDKYASNPEKYIQRANKNKYSLAIGTILTKKYKGNIYQVAVKGEKEYEWENNIYSNLTAIAQKITRGHISGPKFFGLTGKRYA